MKQKVLIVDDEPDALELVKVNLVTAGFFVATAEDGEEALKKARSLNPDLILLDVMLPLVDGLEVCKILRRDDATRDIPINMLTAKELTLRGTFRFHEEFSLAVELLNKGLVDVKPLISATLPFRDPGRAFALATDRSQAMKVLLDFD